MKHDYEIPFYKVMWRYSNDEKWFVSLYSQEEIAFAHFLELKKENVFEYKMLKSQH